MIRKTLKRTKDATFCIELPLEARHGMPSPTGTGFFVSKDGYFVTALHVVTDDNGNVRTDLGSAWLTKESESAMTPIISHGLEFVFCDPATDFVLLKADYEQNSNKEWLKNADGFPFVEIGIEELEEGQDVYSFGYPLSESKIVKHDADVTIGNSSLSPRVTSAIISSKIEMTRDLVFPGLPMVYVLDKALNYGNSGGPILSSETGKVYAFCSRFQPLYVPQTHIPDTNGNPVYIMMPSLYGVVFRLSNQKILNKLKEKGLV